MATTGQPPFVNPAVPFQTVISGGFTSGKKITIEGSVPTDADRFTVDLCFGSDIALRYNPRFTENVVVRNTYVGGKWGTEETDGPMPFMRGQVFTMEIDCEPEFFKIMVNGAEAHKFKHRHQDLGQINILKIEGDVKLTYVNF